MTEMQPATPGNGKQHGPGMDADEMIEKTRSVLRGRLDQQPYMVLGVAAAVGYVLAAGIPRPVMSYLLRYGMKTGLRTGVRSLLGNILLPEEEEQE